MNSSMLVMKRKHKLWAIFAVFWLQGGG